MINLAKLVDLARDQSAVGRKSLVRALTDLFLSSHDDRQEQISLLFGDIVMQVLAQLEEETRMILAKRVCKEEDAPHELMMELAQDSIDVAQPVLQNSPVLTTQDLVGIASKASMGHLGVIAKRQTVEQEVTTVLVDRGDADVLSHVVENDGAKFADDSFLKLVEKARSDESIQAALVNRSDLPEAAAQSLVPFLTKELKDRITSLGADNTLVALLAERAATEVAARAHKLDDARDQSNALINDVLSNKVKLDDAVISFAISDRAAELGMLLAKVSDLPSTAVSQLLFSGSDKPLIIVCKANGIGAEAYKQVLDMRARRLRLGETELKAAVKRYSALGKEGAKRSLDTIKKSGGVFGVKAT